MMCSLAGWEAANVATKYLIIIHFALQLSSARTNQETDSIELYEIVSHAMEDIYQIVQKKIFNQRGVMTLDDHKMIYQLALCASLVTLQVPFIAFSSQSANVALKTNSLHDIIRERTPQQKGIEFLLDILIKPSLLESFLDTLLNDMESAMKLNQ